MKFLCHKEVSLPVARRAEFFTSETSHYMSNFLKTLARFKYSTYLCRQLRIGGNAGVRPLNVGNERGKCFGGLFQRWGRPFYFEHGFDIITIKNNGDLS